MMPSPRAPCGLLAATGRGFTNRGLAGILGAGALALGAGAISGVAAGFVAIAVAFCLFQLATVLADARLQDRIAGPARATVTSLAGLGTEVAGIGVYGVYAAASTVTGHGVIFAAFAVPYVVIASALTMGGRPRSGGGRRSSGGELASPDSGPPAGRSACCAADARPPEGGSRRR
ncbi:hypothetical protein FHR32_003856 [Streptosporangium album]|uniref:Uncharacterized protein n=1 Tax=Streptosporangium album TaxID=47479 RepID=A0A7W7RYA9_9ACTN|nr:hypothetical protein [Streptosporangium album]MBB4939551.1 hypothetical protein [Streptosporangium album]